MISRKIFRKTCLINHSLRRTGKNSSLSFGNKGGMQTSPINRNSIMFSDTIMEMKDAGDSVSRK